MKKPRFKYPSVTEVLEPYIDYSMVAPEVLRKAAIRGTIVHNLCAGYVKFGFTMGVAERYQGYLDSFVQWFEQDVMEVRCVEEQIFNDHLRTCGQMDLLVVIKRYSNELPVVVDIKTPVIAYKTWTAQLAAYKYLKEMANQMFTGVPASLQVKKNGKKAKLRPAEEHEEGLKYWLKALECYHYFSN